jgi:hypothetical protein
MVVFAFPQPEFDQVAEGCGARHFSVCMASAHRCLGNLPFH